MRFIISNPYVENGKLKIVKCNNTSVSCFINKLIHYYNYNYNNIHFLINLIYIKHISYVYKNVFKTFQMFEF